MLTTNIQLQILFLAKVVKHTGFNDLTIGSAGNEYGILINHQLTDATSKFTKRTVDCTAGILGIELMILRIHYEIPAVAQEQTDKVYLMSATDLLLTEINQHLFAGRCVKHVLIDPRVLRLRFDDAIFLQIMHIVSQCLLVSREFCVLAVLDEFLFENIIYRTDAEMLVVCIVSQYFNEFGIAIIVAVQPMRVFRLLSGA